MKLSGIHVQNYRGLKDSKIPLSQFACLIGRNNSGKSSFLQCISLLVSGTKLKASDYYDPKLQIRIELILSEVGEADLARVQVDEHRDRFAELITDGQLRLVRTYEPEAGKASLLVVRQVPKDSRLSLAEVQALMKGKKGEVLRTSVVDVIPELDAKLMAKPTQGDVLAELKSLIASLDPAQLTESDEPLPTGLDKSILPLIPEVVYIPAVKDVADEIKTTESATFGKLLHILFDQIEDQFQDLEKQFAELQGKLSRVMIDDTITDNRLHQVREIEETIQRFVQHNFPDVRLKLEIPAPELRTILSGAELNVDDGYEGPISSKGDGLKRAVAFAVLQAYAELRERSANNGNSEVSRRHPYVLLFEEPELYLHPSAQTQLFEALETFSLEQTVIVTTHNPSFFNASSTKTFVKLAKRTDDDGRAPYSDTYAIDLTDLSARDQLQLIGYENNNAALFSDRVVLVEGDSDFIVLPHIARILLSPENLSDAGISFVRISGKGSFRRYRQFFERFGIPVSIVTDLDVITNQFEKLVPSEEARRIRTELLVELDAVPDELDKEVSSTNLKDIRKGGETRSLWQASRVAHEQWTSDASEGNWQQLENAMSHLLERLEAPKHYLRLVHTDSAEIAKLKSELIRELRSQNVYVLSAGCLEDYFPEYLSSSEKVDGALSLCTVCNSLEAIMGTTSHLDEFKLIFESLIK